MKKAPLHGDLRTYPDHFFSRHTCRFRMRPRLARYADPVSLDEIMMKKIDAQPRETVVHVPREAYRLTMKLRDVLSHLPIQIVHRKQVVRDLTASTRMRSAESNRRSRCADVSSSRSTGFSRRRFFRSAGSDSAGGYRRSLCSCRGSRTIDSLHPDDDSGMSNVGSTVPWLLLCIITRPVCILIQNPQELEQ